jgi:glycosyltransferase involved in cell wall biosynthesis
VHESGRIRVIPALLALIRRLAERHDLIVVALRQYPDFRTYRLFNARVINLGTSRFKLPLWNLFLQWQRFWRILNAHRESCDLIHAIWLDMPAALAVMAGRRLKIPVAASLGGGEMIWFPEIGYGGSGSRLSRLRIRRVLERAAAVTAGSQYSLETIRNLRRDAQWVPLFPDAKHFLHAGREAEGPPWRLLQAASINKIKDPMTLLEALRIIAGQGKEIVMDWIGEDTLGGTVQARAESMGLGNTMVFHGFQEYDRLPDFFRRSHLYVQSSLHESQGVSVCEAAAAGVPVVGTEVGLVRELAPDKATAVPAGDFKALARAILDLLDRPKLRQDLVEKARSWAREHQAGWTAERFETLYKDLASGKKGN